MHTQPYRRKDPNTIQHAHARADGVHPAWWVYSDSMAFAVRKRENALNEGYRRRISDAAWCHQSDVIWAIFDGEAASARAAYDIAIAATSAQDRASGGDEEVR